MRQLNRPLAAITLGVLAACAQIGEPPGGPPDAAAPRLIGTWPESTSVVAGFDDDAEFRFSEIVSEGNAPNFGLGSGDLEKLVVLSPTERVPKVSWKKSRIAVRPREGWLPNRVYRIELLPGVMDLRNNRSTSAQVITFTTGAPIPNRYLAGRVVDWATSRAQTLALVEAVLLPTEGKDSLTYRTRSDSTGRFRFGPLPEGEYLVAGVVDQNGNNRLDRRESFDTVRLGTTRDTTGEIWAFRHDTVAARLQTVASNDSMSVSVTFNQQLDPYQTVPADSVRVRMLPDSTDLEVDTVVTAAMYDSLFRKPPVDTTLTDSARVARARADSVRKATADSVARADSIRTAREAARRRRPGEAPRPVDEGPLKTKPALFDKLVIRVGTALKPGARYIVEMSGVRSVSGIRGRAVLGFQVPELKPPPTDTAKARADSAKARADSAAGRRDTTGARPDTARARPDTARARPDSAANRPASAPARPTAATRLASAARPRGRRRR